MYKADKFVECLVPISHCNLRCEYCYVIQGNYRDYPTPKFRLSPQEIGRAFNPARWHAENLFVSFCGAGETFLCKEMTEIVTYTLMQGNFVNVTNNGTITPAIEKLISLPDDLASRLIFGVSLHYKELKKRNLLERFAENVKKVAASKASFTVQLNLYDGYLDCLDEIKNFCTENFGALPQIALTRAQQRGIAIHSSDDFETYKKLGAQFDSPMFKFACENFLVNRAKNFCYAGENSWRLDLATGDLQRCYFERPYFNIYDDLDKEIPLIPVGRNCRDIYCVNAIHFMALGIIPEINCPSYAQLRDRPSAGWYKENMKIALGGKFMATDKKSSVLLLGDSISLGYREFVRAALSDAMDVYYPPENGRMVAYTFRALYEWSRDLKWPADMDFVYWNNGLWDVVRIFGDEPQTPLPEYKTLIRRTYNRLKHLFPKARIIFATTTPVVEERYNKETFYRSNEDIDHYNEAATQVILECGGIVHDIHGGGGRNFYPPQAYLDQVHFTPQVSQFLAQKISELLLHIAANG